MHRVLNITIFFIVVLYCSYAYLFFYNTGIFSFKPLYWLFFTIGFSAFILVLRKHTDAAGIPLTLSVWLCVFLANSIICYLYSSQDEVATQALNESFKTTVLLLSFLIIFQVKDAVNVSRLALIAVVILSVAMNFMDFVTPLWSKTPGRAAGMFMTPTISGKMLILTMVLSIPLIPKKFRILYCAIAGLGVLVTFSRGAWFLWVVALTGLALTGYINLNRKIYSIGVVAFAAVFVLYSALTGGLLEFFSTTGIDAYLTPNTMARLGGNVPFTDSSAMSRLDVAERAWEVFADNPWFGAGLAFEQSWDIGAHNTFLRMAAEGGIVRLAIFIALLIILWRMTDNIGRVALVVYTISCFTSHDNLRQPALLLILALIATTVYGHHSKNKLRASFHTNTSVGGLRV